MGEAPSLAQRTEGGQGGKHRLAEASRLSQGRRPPHTIASGFTALPVAPSTSSGAITNMNS